MLSTFGSTAIMSVCLPAHLLDPWSTASLPLFLLCVYSFGVIMYELLHRTKVLATLMHTGGIEEAEAYAYQVGSWVHKWERPTHMQGKGKLQTACCGKTPVAPGAALPYRCHPALPC